MCLCRQPRGARSAAPDRTPEKRPEAVRVVVRCRPLNKTEIANGYDKYAAGRCGARCGDGGGGRGVRQWAAGLTHLAGGPVLGWPFVVATVRVVPGDGRPPFDFPGPGSGRP